MVEWVSLDLTGHIPKGRSIEFLKAVMPSNFRSPFVNVEYLLNGEKQLQGLCLDTGKGVFLDHFDDNEMEAFLQEAAHEIVKYLASEFSRAIRNESHPLRPLVDLSYPPR